MKEDFLQNSSLDRSPLAEIDLSAIRSNAAKIKKTLNQTAFCAVVKSDAYGHGICAVADAVSDIADCFAVCSLKEAVKLRFCGITKPILCLLPVEDVYSACLYGVQFAVSCHADYLRAVNVANRRGVSPEVHFAVNSGMNRLGYDDVAVLKRDVYGAAADGVKVAGVFSHFYDSSDESCVKKQYRVFLPFVDCVKNAERNCVAHISASGGFLYGAYNLDMVRIGLLMYGYKPFNAVFAVTPAMKITAKRLLCRSVLKGENILYGQFVCDGDSVVDIYDYGYADGLMRLTRGVNDCCMSLSAAKGGCPAKSYGGERAVLFENAACAAKVNPIGLYRSMVFAGSSLPKKYKGAFVKSNED